MSIDVRILASNESYTFVSGLTIASVGTFMSLVPHAIVSCPARICLTTEPPTTATASPTALGAGNPQRLIVPVWRRGQLLRDTGRLQLSGAVTITGVMYADAIIVNS